MNGFRRIGAAGILAALLTGWASGQGTAMSSREPSLLLYLASFAPARRAELGQLIDRLKTNPNDVDSLIRTGVLFMQDAHGRRGPDFERWMNVSKYELGKAAALAPDNFYARHNYGQALFEGGESIPLEGDQAKFNPEAAAVRSGHTMMRKAVAEFTAAIALNPKSARSYAGRGFALLEMGDTEASRPDLARAIELDPRLRNDIDKEVAAIGAKKTHDAACKAQDSPALVRKAETAFDRRQSEQDASTAVGYLQQAADCGNVEAEYDIARFHELGIGFPRSYEDARAWLLRAAHDGEIGNRPAMRAGADAYHNLAIYSWLGLGEPRDVPQAIRYFNQAQALIDRSSAVGGSGADGYFAEALAKNPKIATYDDLNDAANKLIDKDMLDFMRDVHRRNAACAGRHATFSQAIGCPAGSPAAKAWH
jgi:TPR repeat protein